MSEPSRNAWGQIYCCGCSPECEKSHPKDDDGMELDPHHRIVFKGGAIRLDPPCYIVKSESEAE